MEGTRENSGPESPEQQQERGSSPSRKCICIGGDRISALPDDILHQIVSLLSMKEAVCTSMLSHRWKNVCAYVENLDFDWCKLMAVAPGRRCFATNVCGKNVLYMVMKTDRFLGQHLSSKILSFKLRCCLRDKSATNINGWIERVAKKGIKDLSLSFSCDDLFERIGWNPAEYYLFPTHLLMEGEESRLRHLSLRTCLLGVDFHGRFSTLKTLILRDVQFVGQAGPLMFSSCLNLEALAVQWCEGLDKLNIDLPHLKSLIVTRCPSLQELQLSCTNLRTFYCEGNALGISYVKVPSLEEVYVSLTDIDVIDAYAQLEKDIPAAKSLVVNKRVLGRYQVPRKKPLYGFPLLSF